MTGRGPRRFCMVTTFYPPYHLGGDAVFVYRLANALAERGHQVTVVHSIDAFRLLSREEPGGGYENHPNVTIYGIRRKLGAGALLAAHQTGKPLFLDGASRRILDAEYDVIHYHNVSLMGAPGVLELGRGVKLYTTHEYWLVCPTHVMFRFGREACVEPRCLACTISYRRPPQVWRATGALSSAARHVDAFISPSVFSADLHRRMGFEGPFVHIPLFAPPVALASRSEPLSDDEPFFLCVGRLEPLKGFQTVIPLFDRYSEAALWIAGAGRAEAALRTLARDNPRVRFLGRVGQDELQSLYARAVAVIVPSLCFEIFPQVIIEAFRQRTPVIARRLGSLPEVVAASNGGGLLYDGDDELVMAMDALLTDPARRDGMGAAGFDAYRRLWSPDTHLFAYFELIDEAASRSRPSRPLLREPRRPG